MTKGLPFMVKGLPFMAKTRPSEGPGYEFGQQAAA
jgi:hypothetical protein